MSTENHVVSKTVYFLVFAALLILTYVTREVAKHDLGELNTIVAMTIAVTKATLVILFFMHVYYSDHLIKAVVVSAFVWLAMMIIITVSDYFSRGWLPILR